MKYIKADTRFSDYVIFPKYLMKYGISKLSEHIYLMMLNRTRLSAKSPRWVDNNGDAFVSYPTREMVKEFDVPRQMVEDALRELISHNLIQRKENLYYVLVPNDSFTPTRKKIAKPEQKYKGLDYLNVMIREEKE